VAASLGKTAFLGSSGAHRRSRCCTCGPETCNVTRRVPGHHGPIGTGAVSAWRWSVSAAPKAAAAGDYFGWSYERDAKDYLGRSFLRGNSGRILAGAISDETLEKVFPIAADLELSPLAPSMRGESPAKGWRIMPFLAFRRGNAGGP